VPAGAKLHYETGGGLSPILLLALMGGFGDSGGGLDSNVLMLLALTGGL
jgi:hypothetical protein